MKKSSRKKTDRKKRGGPMTQEEIRQGILAKLNEANRYEPISPDPERASALRQSVANAGKAIRKEKKEEKAR